MYFWFVGHQSGIYISKRPFIVQGSWYESLDVEPQISRLSVSAAAPSTSRKTFRELAETFKFHSSDAFREHFSD